MKQVIIVDIDGTISVPRPERMRHAHVDWDKFYQDSFNDKPMPQAINLVQFLGTYYDIVYLTSRSERARAKTAQWLRRHGLPDADHYDSLIMRPNGDERPSHVVKYEQLMHLIELEGVVSVVAILEDEDDCVKTFRDAGFYVLQTGVPLSLQP